MQLYFVSSLNFGYEFDLSLEILLYPVIVKSIVHFLFHSNENHSYLYIYFKINYQLKQKVYFQCRTKRDKVSDRLIIKASVFIEK